METLRGIVGLLLLGAIVIGTASFVATDRVARVREVAQVPKPRAEPQTLDEVIREAAENHGIAEPLIRAWIAVESGGDLNARNCANRNGTCDYGIVQVNERTAPRYGVRDLSRLRDPRVGLRVYALNWKDCEYVAAQKIADENLEATRANYIKWTAACVNAGPSPRRIRYGLEHGRRIVRELGLQLIEGAL